MVANTEPPDGGWGWVIVICGFINHMFTMGLIMSFSVFYVSWLDQFGESKGSTSWIMSIGVACMFGVCPIPAALAVRFGFRTVAFIGAVLTTSGLILSVFATSVTYLVVSIGLITGVGCCFSYLPMMATVAMYFDKRRSLAMGLNTAGTGIGAFVLAPLLNLLEEKYGWRGAILLASGMTLHMCVTAMLMRDLGSKSENKILGDTLEKTRNDASVVITNNTGDSATTPMVKIVGDHEDDREDRGSLHDLKMIQSVIKREDPVVDKINGLEIDVEELDFGMDENTKIALVHQPPSTCNVLHASHDDLRKSLFVVNKNQHSSSFPSLDAQTFDKKFVHRSITKSVQNMDLPLLASIPSILSERGFLKESSHRDTGIQHDIVKSTDERTFASKMLSSKTIKMNLELLSNKAHLAFCISNFLTNLSYIVPVVFMVDRAVYEGISKSVGAILVSANGIGNVIGRIFFGCITDRFCNRHMCMYITAMTVCGVATMLSSLCGDSVVLHAAYASFFGFLIGAYTVLVPIICVDLVGAAVFATAYGQALFFMGTAAIFGPPLAGWLFDWTQSYLLSYLTMGFFLVMSGVMLLPFVCRNSKTPSAPVSDH